MALECPICNTRLPDEQQLERHTQLCFDKTAKQLKEDEEYAKKLASSAMFTYAVPSYSSSRKGRYEGTENSYAPSRPTPTYTKKKNEYLCLPDFKDKLLTPELQERLEVVLPDRFREQKWVVVYSTSRDGMSLKTLLHRAENISPSILLIKDEKKTLFGMFTTDELKVQPKYYGSGETFVFQLSPNFGHFPWTTLNEYFLLIDARSMAVGGGGGFGIYLDSELFHGCSETCQTFLNPPLASSEMFKACTVELYGISLLG